MNNPNYVDAPYEIAEWTPEFGSVILLEVLDCKHFTYLEGISDRNIKVVRQIKKPNFKSEDNWAGEEDFKNKRFLHKTYK